MSITCDSLYDDPAFVAVADDLSARTYDGVTARTIGLPPAWRPVPPPPNVRKGASAYVAEVNDGRRTTVPPKVGVGHMPSQTAPIGLVTTSATRRTESTSEIARLMRQPRS